MSFATVTSLAFAYHASPPDLDYQLHHSDCGSRSDLCRHPREPLPLPNRGLSRASPGNLAIARYIPSSLLLYSYSLCLSRLSRLPHLVRATCRTTGLRDPNKYTTGLIKLRLSRKAREQSWLDYEHLSETKSIVIRCWLYRGK